jgi:hypothetical protein
MIYLDVYPGVYSLSMLTHLKHHSQTHTQTHTLLGFRGKPVSMTGIYGGFCTAFLVTHHPDLVMSQSDSP